jgi:uncharacterized membrane protein YbhN (UPF0104 family)
MTHDEGQPVSPPPGGRRRAWTAVLTLGVFALACYLLYRTLSGYSLDQLEASVRSFPLERMAAAGGFAALSYFCLTFFDWLGLRYVGRPLPWRKAALASFCSLSIGHNIGMSALSSGAVRYRFYSRWGLTNGQIAKLILFCALTVAIGLRTLAGVALLVRSAQAGAVSGLGQPAIVGIALACLSLIVAYLAFAAYGRAPRLMRRWGLDIPPLPIALGQVIVGALNFACVAACLHQILSAVAELEYWRVVSVYVTANVTALVSHVPGGLGVLESMVLLLLPNQDLIGPLLIFRFVYYLVPLAIGATLFGLCEIVMRPRRDAAAGAAERERDAAEREEPGLV